MSFSEADVRNRLVAMGYPDVPDAIVAQFVARLAVKAHELRENSAAQHRSLPRAHQRPIDETAAADSPLSLSDRTNASSQATAPRSAPRSVTASPSAVLTERRMANSTQSALPSSLLSGRPASSPPARAPVHHKRATATASASCYAAASCAESERAESEKENVDELLSIQRSLARVLQERGIVSPDKSPAPHTARPSTVASSPVSLLSSGAAAAPSPSASSLSSSLSTAGERPSSALSRRSSVSAHAHSSGGRSTGSRLISASAMAAREDERLRGERRGYGAGGYRKTDVVARYQQHAAEWEHSRFLRGACMR